MVSPHSRATRSRTCSKGWRGIEGPQKSSFQIPDTEQSGHPLKSIAILGTDFI